MIGIMYNMNWIANILLVAAVVLNATSDEIKFHWDRLFGKWFKSGTKLEQWFNPSKSWTNKYIYKSKILTYLFSTVFVWATDFWHLLKGVSLNLVYIALLLYTGSAGESIGMWALMLITMNVIWFMFYEGTVGIYGALSDKYKK